MDITSIAYMICGGGLAGYLFFAEPYSICVKDMTLSYSNLPDAFDGYTILHISDQHINKMGTLERRMMELVSEREVDSCFITGDVTANPRASDVFRRVCSAIKYRDKLAFVLGNSEHKPWVDTPMLTEALTFDGIDLLLNSSLIIERGNDRICVAGVDDPYDELEDLDAAFSDIERTDFTVLLTHCPSITPEAIKRGADLILAGHTHGGQLRIPPFGALWTHMRRNSKLNDGLYEGERLSKMIKADAMESKLFVSRGVGTSKLHIRFACKPDIAFITLKKA